MIYILNFGKCLTCTWKFIDTDKHFYFLTHVLNCCIKLSLKKTICGKLAVISLLILFIIIFFMKILNLTETIIFFEQDCYAVDIVNFTKIHLPRYILVRACVANNWCSCASCNIPVLYILRRKSWYWLAFESVC